MLQIYLYKSSTVARSLGKVRLEILVAILATDFQDLVAKVKNLVALAPVLDAILRPVTVLIPVAMHYVHRVDFMNFNSPFSHDCCH